MIVKEKGNSGYVELCQENITMFINVYNKNYGKKINQLCSEIHTLLTGKRLDEGEKREVSEKEGGNANKEGIQQEQVQMQNNTNNVIDMFGFGNNKDNKNDEVTVQQQVKKEKPQFGFIKKKQNAATNVNVQDNIFRNTNVNTNINTNNNNDSDNNNNLFDLISNQQQQTSPSGTSDQQNEQIQQQLPNKKSGFGFIKPKKQEIQLPPMNVDNSIIQNVNQQQQQRSILNEQFNTLNVNTPINLQPQAQQQQQQMPSTTKNTIDMNLLNQLYDNTPNQTQMQQQQSQLHPQQQLNPNYVYMNYPPNMFPYANPMQFHPQMSMMQIPNQNIPMMPYYNNPPSMPLQQPSQQPSQDAYDTLFNPQILSQPQQPITTASTSSLANTQLPKQQPQQQEEEKPDPFGNLLNLMK